jgi:hypothetical protein
MQSLSITGSVCIFLKQRIPHKIRILLRSNSKIEYRTIYEKKTRTKAGYSFNANGISIEHAAIVTV